MERLSALKHNFVVSVSYDPHSGHIEIALQSGLTLRSDRGRDFARDIAEALDAPYPSTVKADTETVVEGGERVLLGGWSNGVRVDSGQCVIVEGGPFWDAVTVIDRANEASGVWHPLDDWILPRDRDRWSGLFAGVQVLAGRTRTSGCACSRNLAD